MKNIAELVMKAQQVQAKARLLQEKLETEEFIGLAEKGKLSIIMTGNGMALSAKIDPDLLENSKDKKIIEDAFVVAVNEAKRKAERYRLMEMEKIQSSLGLPKDFKMPF